MEKLTPQKLIDDLKLQNKDKLATKTRLDDLATTVRGMDAVQLAVIKTTQILLDYFRSETQRTEVTNLPDPVTSVKTPDFKEIVEAIGELNQTTQEKNIDLQPVVNVLEEVKDLASQLPKEFPQPIVPPDSVEINNLQDLLDAVNSVAAKVEAQELDPTINVAPAKVDIDLKPLADKLQKLIDKKTPEIKFPKIPETDLKPVKNAVKKVEDAIKGLRFPSPNFTSSFKAVNGQPTSVTVTDGGKIPVEAELDTTGLATEAKQDDIITAIQNSGTTTTNYRTVIREDTGNPNITYIGNAAIGSNTNAAVWQIKRLDAATGLDKKWADGNDSFDNVFDNRESLSYS